MSSSTDDQESCLSLSLSFSLWWWRKREMFEKRKNTVWDIMNPWGWFWFGSRAVFNLGLEKEEWRKKRKSGVVLIWVWSCFLFVFRGRVWRRKNEGRRGRTWKGRTRKKLECLKLKFHVDFKSTLALLAHKTWVS